MKKKKGLKSIFLLTLTTVLIGGSADHITLSAQAKGSYGIDGSNRKSRLEAFTDKSENDDRMTANEKRIYDTLKSAARQIASGQRSTAVVTVSGFTSLWNSEKDINQIVNRSLSYLIKDCPYDLYWYDKRAGCQYSWTPETDNSVLSMTISLSVASEYQGSGIYVADTAKTKAALQAEEKAKEIVKRHRSESDYDKLKSYMTEICNLVSYNWDVYEDNTAAYGNPWQPVWVFDGDENTNVVCEGYAKAFQYLCDLSTFRDAACYTVEGVMSGGTGAGSHMWNIVTLGGGSYLVDLTNCDSNSIGEPDQLFLAGGTGTIRDGYTFSLNQGNGTVVYEYRADQFDLLGNVLDLAAYSYVDPDNLKLKITAPAAEEVTFGDAVDDQALTGGLAVNGKGEEVPGVFTWADDVTFYGNAGTNTLNAVFTPENPQYQPVENIRVSVKVNRRPVTVSAEAQTKSYGQPDPEFTYTYSNIIEGYPLSGRLTRTSGENAGSYSILQGNLTDANNPNYTISFTGSNLTITPAADIPLEFAVGNARASAANAVTLKENAAYGDLWSDIVKIGSITAKSGSGTDSNQGHFTLQESGTPAVGGGQSFHVVYNGTIGGQTYRNELVCEGTVDVKRRVIHVSAGSYKVSKEYDRTRAGGNATGQLALNNLLAADENKVSVTATPAGYTSSDVGGQETMTVSLALTGASANNYELDSNTVEVPCEITPKTITPAIKVSGSYTYTGRGITPRVTVADGSDVLAASDYEMVLSNNRSAGTAKISIRPKSGSNYTWSPAVETTFTIDKADYKGTKTGTTSMEYGGTAVFSMLSMLPEDYKLGDIRVSDPDKILGETPAVYGSALSCKLVNDSSKEGKSAEITVPVTEATNYNAYDMTFTVTVAPQRSGSNNNNQGASGETGVTPPDSITDKGNGQSPSADDDADAEAPGSAKVMAVDREKSKAAHSGSFDTDPIVWGVTGGVLTIGAVGTIHLIKRKRKLKK